MRRTTAMMMSLWFQSKSYLTGHDLNKFFFFGGVKLQIAAGIMLSAGDPWVLLQGLPTTPFEKKKKKKQIQLNKPVMLEDAWLMAGFTEPFN